MRNAIRVADDEQGSFEQLAVVVRSINTNVASLNAQRRLSSVTSALEGVYQRLSSGLRINRASDDAAGLAVSEQLNVEARVYTQGVRNLSDAVSYLDIAGGAFDSLKTILFRARELATQSANGTLSDTQRGALDSELQELSEEYSRILASTEFNGSKIFEVQSSPITIQFGFGDPERLALDMGGGPVQPETEIISVSSSGTQANASTVIESISGDGRYVLFSTSASNLVSNDTNGFGDMFRHDRLTGETRRVSIGTGGIEGNGVVPSSASMSYDGRYISFSSSSSNFSAVDTNGTSDIYLHDTQTGITELISVSNTGVVGNGQSTGSSVSADGRYVSFVSNATNFVSGDTNAAGDIYLRDRVARTTIRVSLSATGAQLASGGASAIISGDGQTVFFNTSSVIDAGDTNGAQDLGMYRRATGAVTRASTDYTGGVAAGGITGLYSTTFDGRYLAFASSGNLTPDDTGALNDSFVKDTETGTLIRVSVADNEAQSNNASTTPRLSADGRFVAFHSTGTNLVSGDSNFLQDIFVRDLIAGTTRRVNLGTGGVQGNNTGTNPIMSGDGQFVAYISGATNLVAGDTNGFTDVFVSRNTGLSSAAGFNSNIMPFVGVGVGSRIQARVAQSTIDAYLTDLNTAVGGLGATVSRAEAARATIQIRAENLVQARSQIMDADVSEEMTDLTKKRIVQQSAQQVLALANSDLSIVKTLLGVG